MQQSAELFHPLCEIECTVVSKFVLQWAARRIQDILVVLHRPSPLAMPNCTYMDQNEHPNTQALFLEMINGVNVIQISITHDTTKV